MPAGPPEDFHDSKRPRVLIADDVLDQLDLYAMVLEPHAEV